MSGIDPLSNPSAFWRLPTREILAALEEDIRREERRRYGGLDPCELSLEEVGAALWVSDRLREQGILEVATWKMRELIDMALEAGQGYGVGVRRDGAR